LPAVRGLAPRFAAGFFLLVCASTARAGDARRSYFCEDVKKPFFSLACADGACLAAPDRRENQAIVFRMPKPPGSRRVFVVGESAASILNSGSSLRAVSPGLEIVNCGMGGYESYRIEGVFREALKYQPDLIVLLSGNNENEPDPCPGPAAELRRRYRRLLGKFYSVFGRGLPPEVEASLSIQESRVKAMAAAARRAGVPLVICALPSNLMMPPSGTLPLETPGFAAGLTAFDRKDYGGALSVLGKTAGSDPFAAYYSGRALYALGRRKEAAAYLSLAEDLAPSQERAGPARNTMLARVARGEGACLADLDGAFRKEAGGVTGFAQFDDGVHWRPAYNALVWKTIFSAAAGCGIPAASAYRGALPEQEDAGGAAGKSVSYAASWLDVGGQSERSAAELEYLLRRDPAALARAAASETGLASMVEKNFWSEDTVYRLKEVYPLFAGAAAEAYRRAGQYGKALALCEKALSAVPGDAAFLLLKGRILYSMGRPADAAAAFYSPVSRGNSHAAEAVAKALGMAHLLPCSRQPGLSRVPEAKKLSDEGVGRFSSGDIKGAEALLALALALEPENPEALSTLCAAKSRLGEAAAAGTCLKAAEAAAGSCSGPGPERRRLAAGAFYGAARAEAAAGLKKEAARDFKEALKAAPAGWTGTSAAKTALRDLKD
jgi:tetratricopeptide (TPR) repeat protein